MKPIDEVCELPGITKTGQGLNLHFSPIPNWYGCVLGFDCPICDNPIDWKWQGEMPNFTNEETTQHLKPTVKGATLMGFGHRWIRLECDKCHTRMEAENFD